MQVAHTLESGTPGWKSLRYLETSPLLKTNCSDGFPYQIQLPASPLGNSGQEGFISLTIFTHQISSLPKAIKHVCVLNPWPEILLLFTSKEHEIQGLTFLVPRTNRTPILEL